ncbi:MAE_28990/MAE_18760 family HEPN-like nuclease [Crocosphaera sp. UHCC 0190]|uniref:MAE_28990/MAE_18760 family HEPN-like nuclease n=1 Tax=Crocosphaera sp. UHCC 0190 TaxID=3110246 RepID=UPI002B1EA315|nr:MAE_28990/MAE_18760 family HEPN-like nuclease [Crocosphaera sp. UHCC 0190]MEA5510672.1 MAE_28990/MAE_18760 family HEPN-like nuclease [Crocosphaera sp. UHCC 0190]
MKLRNIEQLSDKLSDDIAWRKKELSEVKSLVERKDISDQRHQLFIRSGVCILYSHWEGFVKLAANSYLEYVRLKKIRYDQLSSNFLALAMKDKLKEAKETNKPSLYIPVCDFFLVELNKKCSLPKDAISTASNLSSETFQEITNILGIDFSIYSTKSKLIDEKLLKTRNEIAHGNYLLIDRDEYIELHTEVIGMLETFRNQIENAAINEDFKRNSS